MNRQTSSHILVLLSMVYGMTVAILAMVNAGGIGLFAAIGAMVLGLLWTARSLFIKPPDVDRTS